MLYDKNIVGRHLKACLLVLVARLLVNVWLEGGSLRAIKMYLLYIRPDLAKDSQEKPNALQAILPHPALPLLGLEAPPPNPRYYPHRRSNQS